MAVVGLLPMGCLPVVMTLNSNRAVIERDCMDQLSSVDFNSLLHAKLWSMKVGLATHGARIYHADIYGPLFEMIQRSEAYGFAEATNGCCGTGQLEASFLCYPKSLMCSDASKHVFWDSICPTERTYYLLFEALRPANYIFISYE